MGQDQTRIYYCQLVSLKSFLTDQSITESFYKQKHRKEKINFETVPFYIIRYVKPLFVFLIDY